MDCDCGDKNLRLGVLYPNQVAKRAGSGEPQERPGKKRGGRIPFNMGSWRKRHRCRPTQSSDDLTPTRVSCVSYTNRDLVGPGGHPQVHFHAAAARDGRNHLHAGGFGFA